MASYIKGGMQDKRILKQNPQANIGPRWMILGKGEGFTMRNFKMYTYSPNIENNESRACRKNGRK